MALDHNFALRFMFGGNSEFEIFNCENENFKRYHYAIKQHPTEKHLYFVRYFPSKVNSYKSAIYAGYIQRHDNNKFTYHRGKNGRFSANSKEILPLAYTIGQLLRENLPESVVINHYGKCGICGRKLKDEKSVNRGFGDTCWKSLEFKEL